MTWYKSGEYLLELLPSKSDLVEGLHFDWFAPIYFILTNTFQRNYERFPLLRYFNYQNASSSC